MKLYKITNKVNDRVYVGITIRTLKQRFHEHCCTGSKGCRLLKKAISEYGSANFSICLIGEASSIDELKEREIDAIESERAHVSLGGYNLSRGGDFGGQYVRTEEIRLKIGRARKGKKMSPDAVARLSARHRAAWTPEKQARLIANAFTPEVIAKRTASCRGRKISPEERAKISAALKGRAPRAAMAASIAIRAAKILLVCSDHKQGHNRYVAPDGRIQCRACNARAQARVRLRA